MEHKNIHQKIQLVREAVPVLQDDKTGHGYTYVSEESILSRIKGVMQKLNISVVPSVVPGTWRFEPFTYAVPAARINCPSCIPPARRFRP